MTKALTEAHASGRKGRRGFLTLFLSVFCHYISAIGTGTKKVT
ncbi:hypothetical protein ABC974_09630 [Sphingomonas oligophenolica]|uniref:Uncharacterized protein n=1 Tax=Sphingomonas oligophenolica TaxID=301154 RepID=A0ABU9Y245_9SPHN